MLKEEYEEVDHGNVDVTPYGQKSMNYLHSRVYLCSGRRVGLNVRRALSVLSDCGMGENAVGGGVDMVNFPLSCSRIFVSLICVSHMRESCTTASASQKKLVFKSHVQSARSWTEDEDANVMNMKADGKATQ